jgi:NDP-sugar pyrophosphorylase family protein
MKAIILAGGKGSRLAPYTHVFPKPLMPVGNRPILEIVLAQLATAGIVEAILTVGHESARLFKMVTAAGAFDLKISYSEESKPLGTAGPLTLVKNPGRHFLVLNGDILTDLNFKKLIDFHLKSGRLATVAAHRRRLQVDFGVIEAEGGVIMDYLEKPSLDYTVSMGVYVFDKKVLDYIPRRKRFDFPDLVRRMIEDGRYPAVYEHSGIWLDIGREADYREAIQTFFSQKSRFLATRQSKRFNRRSR